MEQMNQCVCTHVEKAHFTGMCLACEDCPRYIEEEIPLVCQECKRPTSEHMYLKAVGDPHIKVLCPGGAIRTELINGIAEASAQSD